jgi:hypothetical protein
MPYLNSAIRASLKEDRNPMNGGELNFLISNLLDRFIKARGLKYTNINEAVGALECAKIEFYRRVAAHYEDDKIVSNGDVYGPFPGAI